jgi:hypothetical protein
MKKEEGDSSQNDIHIYFSFLNMNTNRNILRYEYKYKQYVLIVKNKHKFCNTILCLNLILKILKFIIYIQLL